MEASNDGEESSSRGRDVSIQEFWKCELLNYYNSFIDDSLLIISNRNLHLQTIHKEFLMFSSFIMRPSNDEHFLIFLTPVFQHLYLLLFSSKGKSDAEKLIAYFKHLPFPPEVLTKLSECKTILDVHLHIKSHRRKRVKLSSYAYHILMNWLKESFSATSEMYTILRVLHENFHVDVYHDKDEQEFIQVEVAALNSIEKWLAQYDDVKDQKQQESEVDSEKCEMPEDEVAQDNAVKDQNKIEFEVDSEKCKMPEDEEDGMIKQMSGLEIESETPQMAESAGGKSNVKINSSMFKLRDSAKTHLENVRKLAKENNWNWEQIEKALLDLDAVRGIHALPKLDETNVTEGISDLPSPPDLIDDVPSEKTDEVMDFSEDSTPMSDENRSLPKSPETDNAEETPEKYDEEMDFFEDSAPISDENTVNKIIDQLMSPDPAVVDDPFSPITSPEDSKYNILSDASTEIPDKDSIGEVDPDKPKPQYFRFEKCYKSNFHSAFPVTISGKDVLCACDVSPDLKYMACSFQSLKICTWHLDKDLKFQPIGTLRKHTGIVYALSIDSKISTLVSGSQDHSVRIWDIEKSEVISEIFAHNAPVYSICACSNSKYFLSTSEDKDIALYWYDELYPVKAYIGHSLETTNCVKFHPNCAYFAAACSDGNVFLFKINEVSRPVRMFSKHKAKVFTLSFSKCGKQLASADVKGVLIIWDILKYNPIKIIETGQSIRSISYDMSGSLIAVVFYNQTWKLYNIEADDEDVVFEAESVGIPMSVHFSEDNKMFVVQYVEADKTQIAESIGQSRTTIKGIEKCTEEPTEA